MRIAQIPAHSLDVFVYTSITSPTSRSGMLGGGGAGTSGDNHKRKLMGGVCKEGVESRHDQDVDT